MTEEEDSTCDRRRRTQLVTEEDSTCDRGELNL